MVSYCSLSNDRSLTNILIENSRSDQIECNHQFNNKPDWVHGLDFWSSLTNSHKKIDLSKRSFDFDDAIGLYLPKYNRFQQIIKTDLINSSFKYEELIKKDETQLDLSLSDKSIPVSNEQTSFSEENQSASQKTDRKSTSENRIRFPLRHVGSRISYGDHQTKKENENLNREKIQNLLKEQITNIFSREQNQLLPKRTSIKIPSVQIKHQNISLKTNSQTDPTLIIERYNKLQQLFISPTPTQPTIHHKSFDQRQSPLLFHGISTFGLTVTPLDFSLSKQLINSSLDNSSSSTNRPATQPVSTINEQTDEQQTILSKRHLETNSSMASNHLSISSQHSNHEQFELIRKYTRQHRPFHKNHLQRSKTFQFLPFIHGKRIDVNQNKD